MFNKEHLLKWRCLGRNIFILQIVLSTINQVVTTIISITQQLVGRKKFNSSFEQLISFSKYTD